MTYLKYNFNDEKLRDEKEQTDCVDLIQRLGGISLRRIGQRLKEVWSKSFTQIGACMERAAREVVGAATTVAFKKL